MTCNVCVNFVGTLRCWACSAPAQIAWSLVMFGLTHGFRLHYFGVALSAVTIGCSMLVVLLRMLLCKRGCSVDKCVMSCV